MAKVVVIGGGVAGLTAAHELKERGFDVVVCERRKKEYGGKARSFPVPEFMNDDKRNPAIVGMPAEHGFRFFPGFYRHVIDTLARIPSDPVKGPGRYVIDDLIPIPHAAYAQEGKALFRFRTQSPGSVQEYFHTVRHLLNDLGLGLSPGEATFAAVKLLNALTMCDERRETELDRVAWWDYMSASSMSDAYRRVVVSGLTQNFVAMDGEKSSTKSVINILARLLNDFLTAGSTLDRILNGPTSEVWIDPWIRYLTATDSDEQAKARERGEGTVTFCDEARVTRLGFDPAKNRITGVYVGKNEELKYADADYFIAAVPVEVMQDILDQSTSLILEHSPSLKLIKNLQVNWMAGIMYYLREDERMCIAQDGPVCGGHVVYLDSTWALTSISQNQFWAKPMQMRGMGRIGGILSTIISDWQKPGMKCSRRTAQDTLSHKELADETLAQIRAHLRAHPEMNFRPENIAGYFVDPAIMYKKQLVGLMPAAGFVKQMQGWPNLVKGTDHEKELRDKNLWDGVTQDDQEPLFINTVGSWPNRPTATTGIDNLFLASDYVRTNTDLATMEGANEAARRAVNAILDTVNSKRSRCKIFSFDEPALLAPLRAIDREVHARGLPHPSFFVDPFISFGARFAEQLNRWILGRT